MSISPFHDECNIEKGISLFILQYLLKYISYLMTRKTFSNDELFKSSQWLKIICEPNRLLLLEKIIEGVQCNCELGEALQIAPNLISHHLSVLREAGLINAERDPVDSRWVYYSVNPIMMDDLKKFFGDFFSKERIQPRGAACGPQITEEQRQSLLRMTRG